MEYRFGLNPHEMRWNTDLDWIYMKWDGIQIWTESAWNEMEYRFGPILHEMRWNTDLNRICMKWDGIRFCMKWDGIQIWTEYCDIQDFGISRYYDIGILWYCNFEILVYHIIAWFYYTIITLSYCPIIGNNDRLFMCRGWCLTKKIIIPLSEIMIA